jgi:hypothetical protein
MESEEGEINDSFESIEKRKLRVYNEGIEDKDVFLESESEDEENEEFETFQKTALPFIEFNEKFKENDEPSTGEEYLCLVRHERSQLPKILFSKTEKKLIEEEENFIQTKRVKEIEVNCIKKLKYFKIDDSIKMESFLQNFLKHKTELNNLFEEEVTNDEEDCCKGGLPGINDEAAWIFKFYGIKKIPEEGDSKEIKLEITEKSLQPTLEFLKVLSRDQKLTLKLIQYHIGWMEWLIKERESFIWLMSLFSVLDLKLNGGSSDIAILRDLIKKLAFILEDNKNSEDSTLWNQIYLSSLNLAFIVANVYGQLDLIQ